MGKRRYLNIAETVGRTPVVRLNRLAPEGVEVWVKLEAFNPMGSVKFTGISGGATLAGALSVAREADPGRHSLHAAGYRRALPEHHPVRGHPGGPDGRGAGDRPLDAGLSLRRGGRAGRAQKLLEAAGVDWNRDVRDDPYSFLPSWLHPRKQAGG